MSKEHSPLPWIPTNKRASTNNITDAEGIVIAEIFWDKDENRDRDFIVECCNNYESLQTNYNNLLQQYEGQAAALAEINKQLDAVKEIFPDLLNLISSYGVDSAKTAIDNMLIMYTYDDIEDFNGAIKDELEAATR